MNTVLSIDFDFWLKILDPIEADWGQREAPFFIEAIWQIRVSDFLVRGKDLRQEYRIFPGEWNPVRLDKLFKQKKLQIARDQITFAESHGSAPQSFEGLDDLHIIQIDAHHDLGYGNTSDDCSDWLMREARTGRVRKITLIYPTWRDKQGDWICEWDSELRQGIEQELDELGVELVVSYGLEANLPSDIRISHLFICRSGAWVPPWVDPEFQMMALNLMTAGKHRTYRSCYQHLSDFQRTLDMDAVQRNTATLREAMDKMKRPGKAE